MALQGMLRKYTAKGLKPHAAYIQQHLLKEAGRRCSLQLTQEDLDQVWNGSCTSAGGPYPVR